VSSLYPWIKALHVIGVIAWIAGMLYLPRLYVYHCGAAPGSVQSETFKTMERRLLRGIVNPAMIASWVFGIALLLSPEAPDWREGWLLAKIALVLVLSGMHGLYARWRKDFEADRNTRPARFYKFMNEVPTLLMILIVILVIVRPF
jgi:putative membrane protein